MTATKGVSSVYHAERGSGDPDLEHLIAALKAGSISSEDLTKTYIARIKQVGGIANAISQLNPEAVEEAIQLDKESKAGHIRGPLHGVPILLKDIFGTLDTMDTTSGSFALKGSRPQSEATVVQKLRKAGAIILGKTNMSEWGNTRSPRSPAGWSPLYGQCYGGYYGMQDPEGSSSGCAIAASMGLAAATIAGETWGSIVRPAQRHAVIGLKPTVGLTSRAGVIPISDYKDSVGPITRRVKDAAIIMGVIAGSDPSDKATEGIPFPMLPDYKSCCRHDALNHSRIAVPRSAVSTISDPEVEAAFDEALEIISTLGASVIDRDFKEWEAEANERDGITGSVFLRDGIETYFRNLAVNPNNIHNLADLIKFMEETPEEETDRYGLEWFEAVRDDPYDKSSPEFHGAMEEMKRLGAEIERLLDETDCDALVAPTSTDIPYDLGQNPAISVPLGFYSAQREVKKSASGMIVEAPNIPFALMFVGRKFSEEKLIAFAYAFEQATRVRQRARLCVKPTIDMVLENAMRSPL